MDLFGDNFLNIRNTHIIPLVNYGIKRKKYEFWSLKDVVTTKIISLNKLQGKSNVEIEVSKADYFNSLHCEIELFMNKSIIQYCDFIKSKNSSPCWSFVTLYYLAFFNTTCFFRFLSKGFIFLTYEQKKRLEDFSLAVYSTPICLDVGNYYFSQEENNNGNIIIKLSFKNGNVHKLNWIQLESTFRNFLPKCDNDEKIIYNLFLSHFSAFNTDYPSSLRNKLNYNGESSILDFENSIPNIVINNTDSNFIKGLSSVETVKNIKNQMHSIAYLTSFLFNLNELLYKEYLTRSCFGTDFLNERERYLNTNYIS